MQSIENEIRRFWDQTDEATVVEEIHAQDSLSRLADCSREEMLLLGLNRRLAQKHLPEAEKEKIRQEIARLEAVMEMD